MNLRLVGVMALGLITTVTVAQAQEKKEEKPATPAIPVTPKPEAPSVNPAIPAVKPEARRALRVESSLKALSQSLNLTDEQKTKIKPILEEEVIKFEEMQQDKTLPPSERSKKFKEVREARQAKIRPILTVEQQEKLDRFRSGGQRRVEPPGATPAAPTK